MNSKQNAIVPKYLIISIVLIAHVYIYLAPA